ncbi:MAG: zinc ABC transporter substrate-binding protein, partial [Candidatus Thermoplasmatota archaeon]|nr:zinc ABC transporter substrate-binding protein [Candidatus Thermoplasmatota archaeon]
MSKRTLRVLFVSSIMILTSLAGCIDSSEDSSDDANQGDEYYGTIMTSTYHVEQLVSAIVGDTATVEMMSTSNIPVHDYRLTTMDTERLKSSDVFFYHGLELEPWVGGILSSEGIPPSYMTHTMPTGEITLDYQTMLVNDLCEQLNSGEKESNTLLSYEDQADQLEVHLEKGVQTLTFPEADTSHDGHDHGDEHGHDDHDEHSDEDGHDDHSDEDVHDDHDGHGDHAHAEAEKVINNPVNCPANTVISIFHLEEGEHVVEFETNWWARTSFDAAVMPMMGGHAHHHDHGHGDGHDDHDGEITPEEALSEFDTDGNGNLSWSEFWIAWTTDDDDHDDHDHDDHEDDDAEEHGDDDHDEHSPLEEAIEEYQMGMLMPMFNESDIDNSGGLSLDELEHFIEDIDAMEDANSDMPTGEFIVSAFDENNDIMLSFEEFSEMMGMEHDDHGDDENHDDNETSEEALIEAMMQMTFASFDANNDSYLNASEIDMMFEMMDDDDDHHQEGSGDQGHHDSDGGEDGHDGHSDEEGHEGHDGHDAHDEPYCHTPDHVNTNHSNREDCEAAGNVWMAGEPN